MATGNTAEDLAASLPLCDDEGDSDLISLCDIVITGIEHQEFSHFFVRKYDHQASGVGEGNEWAIIQALPSAEMIPFDKHIALNESTMRAAVQAYIQNRLDGGMNLEGVRQLVDGSYTDVIVADSILQFALYGEEVFG